MFFFLCSWKQKIRDSIKMKTFVVVGFFFPLFSRKPSIGLGFLFEYLYSSMLLLKILNSRISFCTTTQAYIYKNITWVELMFTNFTL